MADLFQDRIDESLAKLREEAAEKVNVTPETCFIGFDSYGKVIGLDVDIVLLTAPPHFRPAHLQAAVEAGKHVFMEKPVAVDPVGVRSIISSSELAAEKGLAIVAGTQRRHEAKYLELIKRIQAGWIGEIVAAQCCWNWDIQDWHFEKRKSEWSDMEWQIRCWPYFTWLSGDHIVEQHVHNLDVINWAIGSPPVKCMGMGGRQTRTGPEYGNIFDHFAVEYEYPGGIRVMSMCRQAKGTTERVAERIVGTEGVAYSRGRIRGDRPWEFEGNSPNSYVQQHADLIKSICDGEPLNEGRNVAESTMTGIMGRMSAYTGRAVQWDWAMSVSKLDLTPPKYEFGELPVAPVAIPGQTELI
jgi:predicted dehydrogenase